MLDTYDVEYEASREMLAKFTDFVTSAPDRESKYVYFESVPALKYQPYDTPISVGSYTSVQYTVENYIYSTRIPWSKWDEADDQTNAMLNHAEDIGSRAAQIIEELVFQVINGTTDADLLQSIPNAADGSALVITSTRFGRSGGNSVAGATPTTDALAITRFYSALQVFTEFQDTEGKKLHSGAKIKAAQCILLTNELDRAVWESAFINTQIDGSAGGKSNVLQLSGKNPDMEFNTLIDDSKAFVALKSGKPAMLVQERTPFSTVRADDNNSDTARDIGQHSLQGEMRVGIGANVPYSFCQNVNS